MTPLPAMSLMKLPTIVELTTSLIIEMPSLPLCLMVLPTKLIASALFTVIIPGKVSVISYLLLCQLPSP